MNELNEVWAEMIENAIKNADSSGRGQVAEYLRLRATNDSIRSMGCKWLFDSFTEILGEANQKGLKLEMENEAPHRFEASGQTMVGSLLRFRRGLRTLTIEAGWPRTPADGFVRGGGLACGRISHFGMAKANADLILANPEQNLPEWFVVAEGNSRGPLGLNGLKRHFALFLTD